MAEGDSGAATAVSYDLKQLLGTSDRDFLVNSNGDKVNIADHLKGKTVGLYFSASWCGPCRVFTPSLFELYAEVNAAEWGGRFEVVFVSRDLDEESFQDYLSETPWLAVPFSDEASRDGLMQQFEVQGIPHLVVLKAVDPGSTTATVVNNDAVAVVQEYGVEAYPFSEEKVNQIKAAEEELRNNRTVAAVLGSSTRDYVLNKNGDKVPLSELQGKLVGILFHATDDYNCVVFLQVLAKVYQDLKHAAGVTVPFEVVLLSLDTDKDDYDRAVADAPWPLAVPFKDKSVQRLISYFELQKLPALVVLGEDGKTVHADATNLVREWGAGAYPFTPDREQELLEEERRKRESQTLESILVHGDLDYVLGKDGARVPVRDLVGKTVLIYFSAHGYPSCRSFTSRLAEVYKELQAQGKPVDVVFASGDEDEESFNDDFGSMPWLAFPLCDPRELALIKLFKVTDIPTLVALEPSGKMATVDARELVEEHGAAAYPFTESRASQLEALGDVEDHELPERLKIAGHEHELTKTKREFMCDICSLRGEGWAFYCGECDFDAHPKCALDAAAADAEGEGEAAKAGEITPEAEWEKRDGIVCEGDVCRRA